MKTISAFIVYVIILGHYGHLNGLAWKCIFRFMVFILTGIEMYSEELKCFMHIKHIRLLLRSLV